MALNILIQEKVWLDKARYVDAERVFHEKILKEVRKVGGKCIAENALADTCVPKNLKIIQNSGKIKMSESKKRTIGECDNVSLCDEVTEYHKCNDVNKLLYNIEQWDIQNQNQYKLINNYECLVCSFKTNKFKDWICHIMSITHLSDCHKIKDLYSYVCSNKGCKVLLYGHKNLLDTHKAIHSEISSITGIPILMAEVMKRFITKQKNVLHYCSHCKKYAENPIHSDTENSNINIKCPVKYYCKYCSVDFYSSPEMVDYHSLSVEHMTLKCFDKLCHEASINSKKIKTSEQSNDNIEKNLLPIAENEVSANSITSSIESQDSNSDDSSIIPSDLKFQTKMSDAEWVLDLRSCLTSVKNGIPLSQVENFERSEGSYDYNEDLWKLSGTKIPYKDLGYLSLEECIIASGQFYIRNHGKVSILYAKDSTKTQHLSDLIKKQKSKSSKKKPHLKITQDTKKKELYESTKRNIAKCDNLCLCYEVIQFHKSNDVNKLLSNIELWDIENPSQYKSINNFGCLMCYFKTNVFDDWIFHIMSITHLRVCRKKKNIYSYVCSSEECKILFYGPQNLINIHKAIHSESNSLAGIPILMAEVMKRFITKQKNVLYYCSHCKKYAEKPIHSNTKNPSINIKCPVKYYCKYCLVDFYSCPEIIDYHSLSVEHMTLKCYDKLCHEASINCKQIKITEQPNENKENNLLPTIKDEIIASIPLPNESQDTSLLKNNNCINVSNKHMQTVQVKNTSMDVDSVHLLDKKSQEPSLNVCLEEADVNTFNINFETNESLNEKNCKRYTQYFKHKMDVLILLQKYKDHIIKTLVYYCNVCDFVTEEKYIWDKHMDTKHSCATNNSTVHCSICSMMIIGGTYEEHLRTNEHNILLKFIQSFLPGIDNLAKNTKLIKLDDTSTSIKTFLDVEQNNLLDSSEMINIKAELLDNPNSENNCSKKNNSFLKIESSSHSKDLTITNTLSPLENCDQNENIKSVEVFNSAVNKITLNNIIDEGSNFDVASTCGDTISDDTANLENEKANILDEDKAYGEYVTMRLKNIKNSAVKHNIMLEIDNLFYTKVKELLQKSK